MPRYPIIWTPEARTCLPADLIAELEPYLNDGVKTYLSNFTEAVLAGDPGNAAIWGSDKQLAIMGYLYRTIEREFPRASYGSKSKFKAWKGLKAMQTA